MAPGGFGSIAFSRYHPAERIQSRALHTCHTVVWASTITAIDVLNTSGEVSKHVKQVHSVSNNEGSEAKAGKQDGAKNNDEEASKVGDRKALETGDQVVMKGRKKLTPTEQFDAILERDLRDVRKREAERVATAWWW